MAIYIEKIGVWNNSQTMWDSFPHFQKPNPSPVIESPYNRHDECKRITWFLVGDHEHAPFHLQHSLDFFNIHVVHLIDFLLNILDHHHRLLLESKFLIEQYLPTRTHFSILTYLNFGKATKREVSPFFHKVSIKGTKVLLDSVATFKES